MSKSTDQPLEETPETEKCSREGGIVVASEVLPTELFILPIKPRPFFPGLPVPLAINTDEGYAALKAGVESNSQAIGLILVKDHEGGNEPDNLHEVGVAAQILKVIHTDQQTVHVLLECKERFTITNFFKKDTILVAHVKYRHTTNFEKNQDLKAYSMAIVSTLKELVQVNPLQFEMIKMFLNRSSMDDPERLTDLAASITTADGEELQDILATFDLRQRIDKVLILLKKELELTKIQHKISKQIEDKVADNQREFFLREQLKAIKRELGLEKEGKASEVEKFQQRAKKLKMNKEATRVLNEEIDKLKTLEPVSPEYNVSRNYLDWLTVLPWGVYSKDNYNLKRARRILNEDHYGLEDVKERILEFMAVGKLKGSITGSILCLSGPPGVGKTSVGRSIARALNRKFYRFSLGGMRDEAEIKGHRRTYIGAMPGKFIQALKTVETANPVIMLDEIDKIGASFRGDPASALLEVLDPEQNASFVDHYMDVPFDLSQVLFISTANQLDTIPSPLLDRMEVIRLSGYILEEKLGIAKKYLIPKAAESHGIKPDKLTIPKRALVKMIDGYAREAGVRRLEQHIKKIFRKAALKMVSGHKGAITVRSGELEAYLGHPPFLADERLAAAPGIITGLAWTSMGGATLQIEATAIKSKRKGLKQTGQLGEVMVESSEIAYSFVMSQLAHYGCDPKFFDDHFIHLHVPAGATPKDGPSAGITMATALMSLILGKTVPASLAMTGELTLTGRVLPIGGVKEKTIAARRVKCTTLIFPESNKKDFMELPDFLKKGITAHFVDSYDKVFKICFK